MASVKKYVIVTGGDGGYGNLGDEWLSAGVLSHYGGILKKYTVVMVIANIPKNRDERFMYVEDNPGAFDKLGIKVNDIAALHYYGGGYLNTYWMDEKLWLYDHLITKGLPEDKVFFTGLGLGPLDDTSTGKLHELAEKVGEFGVRDRHYLNSIGGEFMFDESIATITPKKSRRLGRKELWINFRIASHVGADEDKLVTLVKQLERFAKLYRLKVQYFAMIDGKGFDERVEMIRVLKRCGIVNPQVHPRASSHFTLLSQFNHAALVITTSYHATLAALYQGIPAVAVYENKYYDLKFTGVQDAFERTPLLQLMNLEHYKASDVVDAYMSRDDQIMEKVQKLKDYNTTVYENYQKTIGVTEL